MDFKSSFLCPRLELPFFVLSFVFHVYSFLKGSKAIFWILAGYEFLPLLVEIFLPMQKLPSKFLLLQREAQWDHPGTSCLEFGTVWRD